VLYWGSSIRTGELNGWWRSWQRMFAGFILGWTVFELLFMFAPVVYLIHLVVLRLNSYIRQQDTQNGSRWERLKRLLRDDQMFAICSYGMLGSSAMLALLHIVALGFYTLYGGTRNRNAFVFVRNVFNCILLEHLPVVVANRHRYQRPLTKLQQKSIVRSMIRGSVSRASHRPYKLKATETIVPNTSAVNSSKFAKSYSSTGSSV
jgi:hypothetical protein